jgi:hypothetical protein
MLLRYLVGMVLVGLAGMAHADAETGARNILGYGCHKGDGTCFVYLDGPEFTGGPECTGNQLRWDAKGDANGRPWLAIIMAAAVNKKKINFYVSGCQSPGHPTFLYGIVEP